MCQVIDLLTDKHIHLPINSNGKYSFNFINCFFFLFRFKLIYKDVYHSIQVKGLKHFHFFLLCIQ